MRFHARPLLESLEERRLLTTAGGLSSPLMIDSSAAASSLIVQYRAGTGSAGSLAAYVTGGNVGDEWAIAPGMREVQLNAGIDMAAALAAYAADPNVLFAEPDYRVKLNMIPNDPSFATEQWDLHNTGQTGGVEGSDIRAPDAWDVTLGDPSVVVAVIDTGVDYTHPDLAPNMWINSGEIPDNQIDDDQNGYVDDVYGYDFVNQDGDPMDDYFHGTHVAGTIAAVADNGIGISGVAPGVRIMALKFLDSSGNGVISNAIAALNYAVSNGATISNNSWGGTSAFFSQAFQTALNNAASHGHIFVAAAGNNDSNNDSSPFYPASYTTNNVVSVAATDAGDYLAWFSNFGKQSVDLGAPGVGIYSTLPTTETGAMLDEGLVPNYGVLSGTSMATPHVAGVIALVRSQHPDWDAEQVIQQVLSTVDPVPSLAATTVTGGRLNAAAALGQVPVDTISPHIVKSDPTGVTKGPIDHVRLTFSEPIDPASFDSTDMVHFNGPDGPLEVLGVTPVPGSNREFDMMFELQSLAGDYTLVIGPHITDLSGNELDQDGDRVGGEESDDDYTATFTIVDSFVYSSSVPVALSGFTVLSSSLTIDRDLLIADVNVTLNITFPRDSRLAIWLVSATGTSVSLSYRHGGSKANYTDTTFDDEAVSPIAQGTAPFDGSFQPDELLSNLDGQNARGIWTLFVQQKVSTTNLQGMLNSWSLDLAAHGDGQQNDPPVVANDSVTGIEDTPLTIQPGTLLANDSDPNNYPLTIVAVGSATGGSVALNGAGTILFTPDTGVTQGSFQYEVSNGHATAWANVTVVLQPLDGGPYDPPLPSDDSVIGIQDTLLTIQPGTLLANDSDPNDYPLTIVWVGNSTGGSAVLNGDGTIVFTPESGRLEPGGFQYVVSNGHETASAHVTVVLQPLEGGPYDPPLPTDDSVTGIQDTPLTIQPGTLLANDSDPNHYPLTIVWVGNSTGGSVVLNNNGTTLFTPDLGRLTPGSFVYVVSNGHETASAHVTVVLQPRYPLHNMHNGNDVNNDGFVSPLDALLVINQLNAFGPTPTQQIRPTTGPTLYLDVVADNFVASNDALAVVNYLNARPKTLNVTAAGGEGESSAAGSAMLFDAVDAMVVTPEGDSSQGNRAAWAAGAMLLVTAPAAATDSPPLPIASASIRPMSDESLNAAAIDECLAADDTDSVLGDLRLL